MKWNKDLTISVIVGTVLAILLIIGVRAEAVISDTTTISTTAGPELDKGLLVQVLEFAVFWGGAGVAGYYVMKQVSPPIVSAGASDFVVRLTAYAITSVLALGAWAALTWLTKSSWPYDARDWVLTLSAVSFTACGVNQALIHGYIQKRNEYGGLT